MRALALDFERRSLAWSECDAPNGPAPGEVLFRVREVGVCGTDRELASFRFAQPPPGESRLILGHEAVGEVLATGDGVTGLAPGDVVVPTLRRSCEASCRCCVAGRRDLCLTGGYAERGILRAHGYFAESAVDAAPDLVRVPAQLAGVAVLVEPLSVVEKALEAALASHPFEPRSVLVLGAGPIGLLACLVAQSAGFEVTASSLEPLGHPRLEVLRAAGIPYVQAPHAAASGDIVIEATGSAAAARLALESLPPLGVLVVLGAQDLPALVGARLILHNQTVRGVVNASPAHFARAVERLGSLDRRHLDALIHRRSAASAPESLLAAPGVETKIVHVLPE